jgi:hypothetical protein
MSKIKIEYQYFEGCPNHEKMYKNILEAIAGLEDKVEIINILVENNDIAKRIGFRGSPTLLINGQDIEKMEIPKVSSFSCRYYPNGIPSVEIIRNKILEVS